MWKWIMYFILFVTAFLVLGFWNQIVYPSQFHFGYVTEGYEDYESNFDPHKLFNEWSMLHGDVRSSTILMVLGNPKIEWNESNRDTEQLIPNGEITSQLVYIFQPRKDDLWELRVYMYRDKDGIIIAYVWDPIKKSYRKLTSNI